MRLLGLAIALVVLIVHAAWAQVTPDHTRADAVSMVDRAAAMLQERGWDATFAAVDDEHGPFRDGELYVFVIDCLNPELTVVANGAFHGLIGVPQRDAVDAEGRFFQQDMAALVRAQTAGWLDFMWLNPLTRKMGHKDVYVRLVDGLIIGAGVFVP